MSATTENRNTQFLGAGGVPIPTSYPVAATTSIPQGVLVAINSSGYAVNAADTASLKVVGMSTAAADNTDGGAGDIDVLVQQGVSCWVNGNAATIANVGSLAYVSDNQTVATSGTSNAIPVGTIYLVDDSGIWCYAGLAAPLDASTLTGLITDLASTSTGEGASLVGVEDAGSIITGATVEAALVEIMKNANAGLASSVSFAVIMSSATSDSVVGRFTPGVSGKVKKLSASMRIRSTTDSKSCQIKAYIGGVATSGGALVLQSGSLTTLGAGASGASMSGLNQFTTTDEITLVCGPVTAFSEGEANIQVFFESV